MTTFLVMPASSQLAVDAEAGLFAVQPPGALTWSSSDSAIASVEPAAR